MIQTSQLIQRQSDRRLGAGADYHWVLCALCDRFFDSHADPGFWSPKGSVACSKCVVERHVDRFQTVSLKPPPAALHIPPRYLQASLRDFPGRIETVAKRWGRKQPFVGIVGPPGTGKTHLAYAMSMRMRDQGARPLFLHAPTARSEWLQSQSRERLESVWQETNALVIDDITRGKSDGWVDVLTNVIDTRTNEYRSTLVTCMETGDEVSKNWGPAFARRLQYFEWISLSKVFGQDNENAQ